LINTKSRLSDLRFKLVWRQSKTKKCCGLHIKTFPCLKFIDQRVKNWTKESEWEQAVLATRSIYCWRLVDLVPISFLANMPFRSIRNKHDTNIWCGDCSVYASRKEMKMNSFFSQSFQNASHNNPFVFRRIIIFQRSEICSFGFPENFAITLLSNQPQEFQQKYFYLRWKCFYLASTFRISFLKFADLFVFFSCKCVGSLETKRKKTLENPFRIFWVQQFLKKWNNVCHISYGLKIKTDYEGIFYIRYEVIFNLVS